MPTDRRCPRSAIRLMLVSIVSSLSACLCLTFSSPMRSADDKSASLAFEKGDHVSVIGNTLADRMQHDGWLETYLHARLPKHELTIRNLGFSGDELTLRLRSADFGTPDAWLKKNKTDVVFAFFGYNESFAGPAGLDKFKKDLESFIDHTRGQQYNGKSLPQLVLFSPIAHENLKDRNLPDGSENNQNLELYTKAMADVAKARDVAFVDLFAATKAAYPQSSTAWTINGVHLNEYGNAQLARLIDQALFPGKADLKLNTANAEKLRAAVQDKNFHWFQRYRTTDGYSIFGGRADLKFVNGQTNRDVAQREMEVLDVMTANRDKVIWALASGAVSAPRESPASAPRPDDSNTPPFIPVITNKPGAGPGGKHLFLDGEEAIRKMTLAKGLRVNLVASEKEFPELANPVQMSFDARGRLWVAVWPTYPHWKPKEEMNDKLLILEDTNGDGKADTCKVFADHLSNPTGFEFWNGGVLIAQAPDLMFLKDTNGDDKADVRTRVLNGLDSADTHHTSNSFVMDPGGGLYFQEGTFHHTQVETPYGPPQRCANAGVFRYEPRTQKFDVYVSFGFANPHGHVFDRWGQDIVVDGTGANPFHAALFSGHLNFPDKHNRPPQVYEQWTRPCPGMEYLSSQHFPESMRGNLLVANVIGYQGLLQYKISDDGASFRGAEGERLLSSTDPNFRPSDLKVGPDGAIYFIDWHNPIIGHMQHNLRDPSRDREHGRIYRITYEGRALSKSPNIAGEPIEKLLDVLKHPEDRVRYRTRIELGGRDGDQVLAATAKWLAGFDKKDPDYEHHVLEGLWLHQNHNFVNAQLLKQVLEASDFRARAAATRVLCYWRDRVPESLELLKKLAADPHPRVRLEAVRAASFYTVPEAIEVSLIAADHPQDRYIEFVRGETQRALEPFVKKVIAEGLPIKFTTPAGARYFLKNISVDDLLKMKRTAGVCLELLARKGVRDEARREALTQLSVLEKKPEVSLLLDAIRAQESGARIGPDESLVFDYLRMLTARPQKELADWRGDFEKLATTSQAPVTRQLGMVALVAADGKIDKAWALALKSTGSLRDFLNAMPVLRDPSQRAALYPKVEPLLRALPKELGASTTAKAVPARYVRVEIPGEQRTLTLAEVEVFSDGRNVARQGKATQKNTAHGGDAKRAIDGNKSGNYGDGGQTHTQENTTDPWLEVDLGGEFPIESIVIWNRTEGYLATRLRAWTLKVLDQRRDVVFEKTNLTTPVDGKATFELGGGGPESLVRRAAMLALTSVRGQEAAAFKSIAECVREDRDRHAAVQALQRIPTTHWPQDEAKPLLDSLLTFIRKLPTQERTSPAALDSLQLAEALAALLPRDQAKEVRKELGELGVRILRVGTVPDQMLYDKERLVVKAGKPFEIIFENNDLMPHNLVLCQPGSLEEVGTLAEATATEPGAIARHFVPQSNKILLKSRLLQPRDVERLRFTAPTKAGVYPYVCTYPGHWRRMYGALYVVDDLDEYLLDAEDYLAKHPLPIPDELLKFVRPRKEWKLEDLATSVEELKHGRSYSHGKQLFQVANCIACHKLGGVGVEIGQDLTKLDPKYKQLDILKEILDPSAKIDDKFASYIFQTQDGQTITGVILEETKDEVKVIENPLLKAQPLLLKKTDIAARKKSPTSIMPKGLLDKLTREEILDLIAYVAAKGDPNSQLFQGEHGHGHH